MSDDLWEEEMDRLFPTMKRDDPCRQVMREMRMRKHAPTAEIPALVFSPKPPVGMYQPQWDEEKKAWRGIIELEDILSLIHTDSVYVVIWLDHGNICIKARYHGE